MPLHLPYTISLFCFLLLPHLLSAQEDADRDAFENTALAESSVAIMTDETLFFQTLGNITDMFGERAVFDFSAVRYLPRGYDRWHDKTYINNIRLGDPLTKSPSYQLLISLSSINRNNQSRSGISSGSLGRVSLFNVRPHELASGSGMAVSFMDRAYRSGIRAYMTGASVDGKWGYSVSAAGRWGRNGHIDGMFTESGVFSVGLQRAIGKKNSISFFGIISPTRQGLRSASVAEAFDLTGDNLYNPSWGYYGGKLRNSRVRETMQPFGMLTFDGAVYGKTKVAVSVAYMDGMSSQSGLWWLDGMNPYPDYYRYLPSFSAPLEQQKTIEQLWRDRNADVIQINWDELRRQNLLSESDAVYVLENKTENYSVVQADIGFTTEADKRTTLHYGISARVDDNIYYSEAKDRLGSDYSGRRYDYGMSYRELSANAKIDYRPGQFYLWCAAELSAVTIRREEADNGKRSGEIEFSPYNITAGIRYSYTHQQSTSLSLMSAREHPAYTDIFLSHLNSNKTIANPEHINIRSAEVTHSTVLRSLKFTLCGYYTEINDATNIRSYYDDLTSQFCIMVMRGVNKKHYGAELAVDIKLSDRLSTNIIGAVGNSSYGSNPTVDILAEYDFSDVSLGEKARINGYRIGSTPQTIASTELVWSGLRGWRIAANANYMANSYVAINPLRRTPRYYSNVGSEEKFNEMITQERLPEAVTVNLVVMKSMFLRNNRLFFVMSVNNLLDKRDIVFDGYEQMRIRRPVNEVSGDWTVFPTKYRFGYGRTYFCSVNYKF